MIVDCFKSLGNPKLLEARLAILAPYVDKFLIFDAQLEDSDAEFEDKIVHKSDFNYENVSSELENLGLGDTDVIIFSKMNSIPNLSKLNELSDILLSNYGVSLISSVRSHSFDKKAYHKEGLQAISNESIACFYHSIKAYTLKKIWEDKDSLFEYDSPKGWCLNFELEYEKTEAASTEEIPEILLNDMDKYKELLSGS